MEVLIWIVCISMLIGFSTGVITGYGLAWWSGQGTSTPEEPMCFDKSVETERSLLSFHNHHHLLATGLLIRLVRMMSRL